MPRQKQPTLPADGMEGPGKLQERIKELDILSDKYVDVRDTRMKWTKKEVEARAALIAGLQARGLSEYVYGDQKVVLKAGKDGVKVTTVNPEEETEEEGED